MRNFIYEYNLEHLNKKDDIAYYILGAVLTDGCIKTGTSCGQVSISSSDEDWLQDIKNFVCPDKPIYFSKKDKCYTLTLSHPKIKSFFIDNGIGPRKSLSIKMPQIPIKYLPDFLRGCIDGDGCITIDNSIHCELSTGSKNFAQSLFKLLKNFNPKLYVDKKKYYKLRFNGAYAYKFLQYIYYEGHQIGMARKIKSCQDALSLYNKYRFDPSLNGKEIEHFVRIKTQSGSNNGGAKLDEEKVNEILSLSKTKTTKELAIIFKVSKKTINSIKSGRSWKFITN